MLVSVIQQVGYKVDKQTGEKSPVTTFFVQCGKAKIPINVVKFPNEEGFDPAYSGKVRVLEAFDGLPVNLLKRKGKYEDSETEEEKHFTNFFLQCGDDFIPVAVLYISNGKDDKDPNYGSNKRILSAFAETLPPRENVGNVNSSDDEEQEEEVQSEDKSVKSKKARLEPCSDSIPIPFE